MQPNKIQLKKSSPNGVLCRLLFTTIILISQSSCFQHYYQTNTRQKTDFENLKKLNAENKYFIVHASHANVALKNIRVDSNSVSGNWELLGSNDTKNLYPTADRPNRYPKRDATMVLSQVHIYTDKIIEGTGRVEMFSPDITRVDVYSADLKADQKSKTWSIIGIASGPFIIVGVMALIALSSSPYKG